MKTVPQIYTLPNWFWKLRSPSKAFVIFHFMFFKPEYYKSLKSNNPAPYALSLLIHEQTHIQRAQQYGVLRYILRVQFDKKFRFQEELAGYKKQMGVLKQNKLSFDFEGIANALSGKPYRYTTDYQTAIKKLKKAWNEV